MQLVQNATDDFAVGQFQGRAFHWQTVNQRGFAQTPRFGHNLTKCDEVGVVYGGLDLTECRFTHVNNHVYIYSLRDQRGTLDQCLCQKLLTIHQHM